MSLRGLFHLCVVYFVWGSTYLGIRVAVREGSGFPPFTMVTLRIAVGCAILFAWAAFRRSRLRLSRAETLRLALVGVLLWLGGNGLVSVAEKSVGSGYSALLLGSTPIWVAVMEAIVDRALPSWRLAVALVIGLAGVAVLNGPVLLGDSIGEWGSAVLLVLAALLWGMGTLIQRRRPFSLDPEASAAYQQLFGGIALALAAILTREPFPHPTPEAWWAWGYLAIFGSVFAFTSFVKAVQLLPTDVVMTYAYVNPVIAVFLGWLILGEAVTVWTIAGAALVILGVAGVFHEKRRSARAIALQDAA